MDDLAEFENNVKLDFTTFFSGTSLSAMAKIRSGYAILKDVHPTWQSIVYEACIVKYAECAKAPPLGQDIEVKRRSNPLYCPGRGQWGFALIGALVCEEI